MWGGPRNPINFLGFLKKLESEGSFDYETFHQKGKLFDFVGKKKKKVL